MNPFDVFMTEQVYLIKKTTDQRIGPYQCMLMSDSCAIDDKTLDVDPGDLITRTLPNGKEEQYTVLRADYREDFEAIPGGYELKLRKEQQIHNHMPKVVNNVNISNSTGFQVGDYNTQANTIQSLSSEYKELQALVSQLQQLINNSSLPEADKKEAIDETKIIAEITTQPREKQQNIVRKSLSYIKELTTDLEGVSEIAAKLSNIIAQVSSAF